MTWFIDFQSETILSPAGVTSSFSDHGANHSHVHDDSHMHDDMNDGIDWNIAQHEPVAAASCNSMNLSLEKLASRESYPNQLPVATRLQTAAHAPLLAAHEPEESCTITPCLLDMPFEVGSMIPTDWMNLDEN